jgi:hypothetical protein
MKNANVAKMMKLYGNKLKTLLPLVLFLLLILKALAPAQTPIGVLRYCCWAKRTVIAFLYSVSFY